MAKMLPFGRKAWTFVVRDPAEDKKYTILEGSVRSSKTWAVTAKLITKLCAYEVEGQRIICGKTKQTVYKNVLMDLRAFVGKENFKYDKQSGEMTLFGTTWFVYGAADEGSQEKLQGMTVGIAIVDEGSLIDVQFLKQLFLRMSPDGARMYMTTNPGTPYDYLSVGVIHNAQMEQDIDVIHFTLDDNPHISTKTKDELRRSQKGVFYLRYILGQWVVAEGAIYRDSWSDENLYNEATRPKSLYNDGGFVDYVISIDHGIANPFCALEHIDDGVTDWIDRELWYDSSDQMKQLTNSQLVDMLEKWLKETRVKGRHGLRFVVDPAALDFIVEMESRGYHVIGAENEVIPGIQNVSTQMAEKRIRVNEDCTNLCRETPAYAWKSDKENKPLAKEEPVKKNDHAVDAMRYGVNEVFQGYRRMPMAA